MLRRIAKSINVWNIFIFSNMVYTSFPLVLLVASLRVLVATAQLSPILVVGGITALLSTGVVFLFFENLSHSHQLAGCGPPQFTHLAVWSLGLSHSLDLWFPHISRISRVQCTCSGHAPTHLKHWPIEVLGR